MVMLDGDCFDYLKGYQGDARWRHSLNALTRRTFGFDFEAWVAAGYWQETCVPHSLAFEGNIVSNILASRMDFDLDGERRTYVQLGTVMTDPAFRGRGLSRFLMEEVLRRWRGRCDLIFLLANDSVTAFYPKFGFETALEIAYTKRVDGMEAGPAIEKVDVRNPFARSALYQAILSAMPISSLSMAGNEGLVMFHAMMTVPDDIYCLPAWDAYAVAEHEQGKLLLRDVFCPNPVDVEAVASSLLRPGESSVVLGFTPKDRTGYEATPRTEDTLFVLGPDAARIQSGRLMFPMLSHT